MPAMWRNVNCSCSLLLAAIAIKESAHVGDKNAKRLARGVDDLGKHCFKVKVQV